MDQETKDAVIEIAAEKMVWMQRAQLKLKCYEVVYNKMTIQTFLALKKDGLELESQAERMYNFAMGIKAQ